MSLRRAQRGIRQLGGFAGGTSHLARPPAVLEEPDVRPVQGCVLDRDVIPTLFYGIWPYFTLDAPGSRIFFTNGNTIEEFDYPGLGAVGTYVTAEAGYEVLSVGMLPSGDLIWWETNFTTFKLRTGAGGTLVLIAPAGYVMWRLCVSPYDGECYVVSEEDGLDADLNLWRLDGSSLTSVSSAPANDLINHYDEIGLAATLDGGIWIAGGSGVVGRYDIPSNAQHYSADNGDPGGGVYSDGATPTLIPMTSDQVSVVSSDLVGKLLTWDGTGIVIADHDCLDGYYGGASGWSSSLGVTGFYDGNDDRLYQLLA